jgi:tetratricopeptide (TPR) repeat protein
MKPMQPTRNRIVLGIMLPLLLAAAVTAAGNPAGDLQGPARQMQEARQLFQLGQYAAAASAFDLAGDLLTGSLFQDDAEFQQIRALEASGQEAQALLAWRQWLTDNPDSPLRVEAQLAVAWNLTRGGQPAAAEQAMADLAASEPWLGKDQRLCLVRAAAAHAGGNHEGTLGHLAAARQAGPLPAVGLMLEGMSQSWLGQDFAAAVAFQELIDEHRESPLRGYALMAKGGIFPGQENFRAAADEFDRWARQTTRPDHRAEAEYMAAACLFLGGAEQQGLEAMHQVAVSHAGATGLAPDDLSEDLGARALFSLGEMRWLQGEYELAIVRFNEVLTFYFASELAGSALYRTGRCLDALGRTTEANSTYQAVAEGYPYAPEAPAAVYLAGVGLFEQGQYLAAAPYFQLILDRYSGTVGNVYVFTDAGQQELVEASLCLLEYSYYQAGEYGQMAGAPHLALQKMPPSPSMWRAYTLLLDADALAAVDRYPEAQQTLATLLQEFPDHAVGIRANRLLAWTYARQGRQDLAIETEQSMVARYSAQDDRENLGASLLTIAHSHFNAKRYDQAALSYRQYVTGYPDQGHKLTALYQEGLCYVRLGQAGDAVDRWAEITAEAPQSPQARKAWQRSGDILFQAGHFDAAREQFTALMASFPDQQAQAAAILRLGRCDYNEGKGREALALFRQIETGFADSPEAAEAIEGITQILYSLGLQGDSEAMQELVAGYPDSPLAPEGAFELARGVYEAGDYAAAADRFDDLCGKYPRYSAADRNFYYAADAREKAGQLARAEQAWNGFLRYFPHSELAPAGRFHLAAMRFNDGRYHLAVEDFRRVLAMAAEDEIHAAALFNLAMCHRILGESGQALAVLEQFREKQFTGTGREIDVARTLGEIHREQGHLREAARQFQAAVELGASPDEAVELNYLAGICLKEAGDFEGALGAYAMSIESDDKTNNFRLSALAQTADLCEQDGNFDGALAAYRDLITNATDPALIGAAQHRVTQLEAALGR